MNRFLRAALLFASIAALVATGAGCGDGGKPAEPKITGGNVDPNLKRVNNAQGGAPAAPKGGPPAPQTAGSAN